MMQFKLIITCLFFLAVTSCQKESVTPTTPIEPGKESLEKIKIISETYRANKPGAPRWTTEQWKVVAADLLGGIQGGLEGGAFGPWGALAGGLIYAGCASVVTMPVCIDPNYGTNNPSVGVSGNNPYEEAGIYHNIIMNTVGNNWSSYFDNNQPDYSDIYTLTVNSVTSTSVYATACPSGCTMPVTSTQLSNDVPTIVSSASS